MTAHTTPLLHFSKVLNVPDYLSRDSYQLSVLIETLDTLCRHHPRSTAEDLPGMLARWISVHLHTWKAADGLDAAGLQYRARMFASIQNGRPDFIEEVALLVWRFVRTDGQHLGRNMPAQWLSC